MCHPGFLVVSGRDSLEMEKCSLFQEVIVVCVFPHAVISKILKCVCLRAQKSKNPQGQ